MSLYLLLIKSWHYYEDIFRRQQAAMCQKYFILLHLIKKGQLQCSYNVFIHVLKKKSNWKKQNKDSCFASANLESVCDSSAYGQVDINPFCLYPRRKLYLLCTPFSLPVSWVSLTHTCGNPRLSVVSNICTTPTNACKLLMPVVWIWSWHQSTRENFAHFLSFQNQKGSVFS